MLKFSLRMHIESTHFFRNVYIVVGPLLHNPFLYYIFAAVSESLVIQLTSKLDTLECIFCCRTHSYPISL